jgi:hypothetical protein
LSLKGAKSPTRGRKLRSTGTKARTHISNGPASLIELKNQLEARTHELVEARFEWPGGPPISGLGFVEEAAAAALLCASSAITGSRLWNAIMSNTAWSRDVGIIKAH